MTDQSPPIGVYQTLEPGIRRILAPNPSPMTYWGTNTYVLGHGDVVVLDPGPNSHIHLDAILDGLEPGEHVSKILVTHAHLDHSPLAKSLSDATGAPIYAFGDAQSGRSDVMRDLVASGLSSGGEGVDASFKPDEILSDGDILNHHGTHIEAIWTPGHFANHLSFCVNGATFTGDHVMGWASSLVSPPDGDLTAFMESCEKLRSRDDRIYYPGHGAPVKNPIERLNWLINHRKSREADILSALESNQTHNVTSLTRGIYTDTPKALLPAAERNVFAHLIDLCGRKLVQAKPSLNVDANFFKL